MIDLYFKLNIRISYFCEIIFTQNNIKGSDFFIFQLVPWQTPSCLWLAWSILFGAWEKHFYHNAHESQVFIGTVSNLHLPEKERLIYIRNFIEKKSLLGMHSEDFPIVLLLFQTAFMSLK